VLTAWEGGRVDATDDEAGVAIDDLHFAYGAKKALDGISLNIRRHRFTAILGPNGAGKSTLFSLLCGLLAQPAGHIRVLGRDLARSPRDILARMGIVFQQPTLDLDLTVAQNLAYFGALRGLASGELRRRCAGCLERMGLAGREHERARDLNGGHRRRLEIARALLCEPDLLLLDEPTVGLDVASRADLVSHAHALSVDSAMTVIWATHLVDEIWPDDDLVVLYQGQVRAAGPVTDVLASTGAANVHAAFSTLTSIEESQGHKP